MTAEPSSIDPAEVERFSAIAAEWWDPHGKFAPLHKLNPVRLAFIREQSIRRRANPSKGCVCSTSVAAAACCPSR